MYSISQAASYNLFKSKKAPHFKIIRGKRSILQLAEIINIGEYKSVFIVSSKTVDNEGMLERFKKMLTNSGIAVTVFKDLQSDPTEKDVEKGYRLCMKNQCDCITAVGGGSVLDCAKVIALRAANPHISLKSMRFFLTPVKYSLPVFAVPTTAGTGSEVTFYSIITDSVQQRKYPIISDKNMPEIIIFDTEITCKVPKNPTAYAGMDALTHAVESYISKFSPKFEHDTQNAPKACKMIFNSLEEVCRNPENANARKDMSMASLYAGLSFRHAGVGYIHAIAHRLGELYHIPHGMACAVVMPHVLKKYLPQVTAPLAKLSKKCGFIFENSSCKDRDFAIQFIKEIIRLNKSIGIPETLSDINKKDFPVILKRIHSEVKYMGSPVTLSDEQITDILCSIQ